MKPNARFPLVPLPYTLRAQAMPNEIIMNYDTGDLFLTKSDPGATGDARFINIADSVAEELRKTGAPADSMTVTIPSGTPGEPPVTVTLAASITDLFTKLKGKAGFADGAPRVAGNLITIGTNGELVDSGQKSSDVGTKDIATDTKDGLMSKEMQIKLKHIEAEANKYVHPASHPASMITEDTTHRFTSDVEKVLFKDKYNKSEIDNKFSTLETNIDWKEAVANFAAIATTYPHPVDGWTVNVKDTDITYRYNGTAWIAISANSIPKATTALDGLMPKEAVSKLDGIAFNANNYTHPADHPAAMIVEDANHRFTSDVEKNLFKDKYNKSEIDNKFSTLETNIDWKEAVATFTDIATTYPSPMDGWTVNVKDTDITYRYNGSTWIAISANSIPKATTALDGLMPKEAVSKLEGIEVGATNYKHPGTHPATMITEDTTHRFTTDAEKAVFADKYNKVEIDNKMSAMETNIDWKESVATFSAIATTYPHPVDGWTVNVNDTDITYRYNGTAWIAISANSIPKATAAVDGLMPKEAAAKLDGIDTNANKYIHPATHPATIITEDANHRFTSDVEKDLFKDKYNKSEIDNKFSTLETNIDWKEAVANFAAIATTYPHPVDGWTVNVNDTDITYRYNGTAWIAISANSIPKATAAVDGLMPKESVTKLDTAVSKLAGIDNNANNYTHPGTHPATMITEDVNHRFTTDAEKVLFKDKYNKSEIDNKFSTLETNIDWKEAVNTFANIATTYPNPIDGWTVNVKDTDITYRYSGTEWVAISANAIPKATGAIDGLMPKEAVTKLAGIEVGATNYKHPGTHPATMITEDAAHRFTSDTEKSLFGDKYNKSEIDNKFSALETNIDWKEAVANFAAIATTYPNPVDGWTVNVNDTDITYRYNGTAWIAISANSIPKATAAVDGLMPKESVSKLAGIDNNANNYTHPGSHPATMITEDATHRFTTDAEKVLFKDKYNKSEIDNKFSTLETNIDWKEAVANYAAIATTYPNPMDGWTVNVNDTDITYRFNGTAWIAISANSIPKATTAVDGLMTKEMVTELNGIPALLAKKMNLLPVSAAGKIVTSDANGNLINLETKVEDTIIEDHVWSNSTNMNSERYGHSAVGITNNCIIMGGTGDGAYIYINTTEVYNGSIWSNSTNMNSERYGHSAVGITNDCMVMGGSNGNTTEVYNGSIWSNSTNMNRYRSNHSAVGITNNSMVMGGYSDAGITRLNSTEVYNGTIWSNSTNMNSYIEGHTSVGITNNSMVMGGYDGSTSLNSTEVYNGSIWYNRTNMNSGRSGHSSVGITNNSMVMGGSNVYGGYYDYLNTTEVYNGSIWSNSTNMNSIRYSHSSVGITNNSMVMGGTNSSNYYNTTEVCTTNNTASSSYRGILNKISIINNDFISKKSTDVFSAGPNMTYTTVNNAANGVLGYTMSTGGNNTTNNCIFNGTDWKNSAVIPAAKSFHQSVGPVNDALIFSGNTATSYLFNGAVWSSGVSVPGTASKQGYGAVGVSKACIHIGYTGATNENKIFDGTAWKVAPTSLAERHSLSATGTMNASTVIGGNLLSTEVFNGSVWSAGPNVLVATTSQSAVGNNNNARRICGYNGTKSLSTTEKIVNGIWTASPSMANERKDHASTGGSDGSITVGGIINGSMSNSTEFIIHAYSNTLDGINSAFESVYNAINIMNVNGVDTAQLDTLSTNLTKQITDTETRLDEKMKSVIGKIPNVAILASGWTYNGTVSKYVYKINNAAITADRVVNVNFPLDAQEMASFFGIASITQSYAGYVEIYSDLKPTMDMTVSLVVE